MLDFNEIDKIDFHLKLKPLFDEFKDYLIKNRLSECFSEEHKDDHYFNELFKWSMLGRAKVFKKYFTDEAVLKTLVLCYFTKLPLSYLSMSILTQKSLFKIISQNFENLHKSKASTEKLIANFEIPSELLSFYDEVVPEYLEDDNFLFKLLYWQKVPYHLLLKFRDRILSSSMLCLGILMSKNRSFYEDTVLKSQVFNVNVLSKKVKELDMEASKEELLALMRN